MLIDFENHIFLEEQLQPIRSPAGSICERYWNEKANRVALRLYKEASDPEYFLKWMDEAGIDMAVLTVNLINGLEPMKRWNDFCATVVKKYPKRFVGFAVIPPAGGKAALDELDRAVNGLGMRGVHIWTHDGGYNLDSPEMYPFYEKVSKLKIPVDVHVTLEPPGMGFLDSDYGMYFTLAREYDMSASVLRLCLGGVLESYPDITFIMNHFGGGVSSIIERVDWYSGRAGSSAMETFYKNRPRITRPWREYFDKLYFNIAGREVGVNAVQCALTNISTKRLVFGTDWPFNFDYRPENVKKLVAEIKNLGLPAGAVEDICGENAKRILKLA